MDGVGKRLAEIDRRRVGHRDGGMLRRADARSQRRRSPELIPNGCNASRTSTGLKSEVIIPEYSRNVYDHAIRMLGVKVIEVRDRTELESAIQRAYGADRIFSPVPAMRDRSGPLRSLKSRGNMACR